LVLSKIMVSYKHTTITDISEIVWTQMKLYKILNGQNLNFMNIVQTFYLAKTYFKTNYNFWIVNSVQKANILPLKMDLQSCQVNKEYIRINSKRGITQ